MKAEKKTFADWNCLHFNVLSCVICVPVYGLIHCVAATAKTLARCISMTSPDLWPRWGRAVGIWAKRSQEARDRSETVQMWHVVACCGTVGRYWGGVVSSCANGILPSPPAPMPPQQFGLHTYCDGRHRRSDIEWPPCDQDASVPFRSLMKLIGVVQDRL